MPVSTCEIDRRVDALVAGIRKAGLRLTHQRFELVREIAGSEAHPDVETIYCGVRRRVPTISLDTVYRTLSVLTELGLIDRVTGLRGPARYDGNPFHHHHFVCTSCGLVRDIDDMEPKSLGPTEQTKALGEVRSVNVRYNGICVKCQRPEASADDRDKRIGGN